jgi:glycosyltransferase involved in cell wall biosynthesis
MLKKLPPENQIMANWQADITSPVVSVCCMAYNHGPYIEDALEGFLIQETDFPFEIIIHDDASIDNTADIIRHYQTLYPQIIKPVYQSKNQYSQGKEPLFEFMYPMIKGKYIALCEGDDFWVCPQKLQKQVDFLESNPEYGVVHSDVHHLNQATGKDEKAYNKTKGIHIPQGQIFTNLFSGNHLIKLMTACVRKELFDTYYVNDPDIMAQPWKGIDISIWMALAPHTKIYYMDEVFATYRLLPESMSRTADPHRLFAFHQTISAIKFYFADRYQLDSNAMDLLKERYHRTNLFDAYRMGDKQLSKESFEQLKKICGRVSPKERLFYLAAQNSLLKKVVESARNILKR